MIKRNYYQISDIADIMIPRSTYLLYVASYLLLILLAVRAVRMHFPDPEGLGKTPSRLDPACMVIYVLLDIL